MHPKVFACLLISALIGTSLSRSLSESNQEEDVQKADQMQRRIIERFIRQEWPQNLSKDQKHLVSQFLPHIYAAELASRGNEDAHGSSWLDFGRRSSED